MTDEEQTAALEAAQRVVDEVSSYQYSAEESTIEQQLDHGLARANVSISSDERTRLVAEIEGLKNEQSGTPQVHSAFPVE